MRAFPLVFSVFSAFSFSGLLAIPSNAQSPSSDRLSLPGALYPDIVQLYEGGQIDAALTALDQRTASSNTAAAATEALLLRARLLTAANRHTESAELWQAIADREPALVALARRATIENRLAGGDLPSALAALTPLETAGTAPADLLIRAADACRSAGLLDRAIALFRRAQDVAGRSSLADTAGLALAGTLEQAGQPREALDVFSGLQLTFRSAAAYDTAAAAARRLSQAATGSYSVSPLSEDDYETIADRLKGITAFRRAVDVREEWRRAFPSTGHAQRIEASIIDDLYALRDNEEARARADVFLRQYPDSPQAPSVRIVQFRLDVRAGRTADVKARGLAIWRGQADRFSLNDRRGAARLLAEYLVSVGEAAQAIPVYDELYRQTSNRGDRIDVLWRMSIAAWRAERRDRATSDFRRLLAMNPDSETRRAATYWLAVAEQAQGLGASARNRWAVLDEQYPYSYYGLRAVMRLAELWGPRSEPHPDLSFPHLELTDSVRNRPDYRAAELLAKAGLRSDAAVYARRLAGNFPLDGAVALLAARAADAAGDHASAAALATATFGTYLERPAAGVPDDLWALAYPLAYWTEITAAAERHHVDPLLMLALARQESHFDRTARSPAGAVGLFQIMPATAERLGAPGGTDAALTQVETSADLAAALLNNLLTIFNGALAPAVAAYNAGEDRVQVWWASAQGLPEELFVDSIPYRETRGYVRQVLANYAMYQRLASK